MGQIETTMKKRIDTMYMVESDIDNLQVKDWEGCTLPNLKNIVPLGYGSFGEVTIGVHKTTPVVIKNALYEPDFILGEDDIEPEEYTILKLIRDLVVNRNTPNLILVYNMTTCGACTIEGQVRDGPCYITYMEKADGDLSSIVDEIGPETQMSVLFQLLATISIIQLKYQLVHNDIKEQNVLFIHTPMLKGTYMEYNIGSDKYLIHNTGILVLLADFGVSIYQGPTLLQNNFEILSTGNIRPLGKITDSGGLNTCTWIQKDGSTFYTERRTRSGPQSNPGVYPPNDFFIDIQDTITMFTGGKRSSQPGYHKGFQRLSKRLKSVIDTPRFRSTFQRYKCIIPIDGSAKFFSANRMLRDLYGILHLERDLPISEVFSFP